MTNIWAWVRRRKDELRRGEPGGQRLAQLMDQLPSAACDEAHAQVDALVPEGLALARELDEPWVELFIRHWSLQSRVLHRQQARDELREAVDLLDFASGPRVQACPQSVCAVQDLAVCYAIRDGVGYVDERLAVARETLARIDPSWDCFDCIIAEYLSALLDDERPAEALEFLDAQTERLAEHGVFDLPYNMVRNRAVALRMLGRSEEALRLLDGMRETTRGRQMTLRLTRVQTLLALDRVAEAAALHPPLSAVQDTAGHFEDWVACQAELVERGAIENTHARGRELLEVSRRLEANEARWGAAQAALTNASLAIARGARAVAELALADYDRIAPGLRRPARLQQRRAALGEALSKLVSEPVSEPAAGPEQVLDRLTGRGPALVPTALDTDTLLELAAALRELGRGDRVRPLLEARASTGGLEVTAELADTLLAAGEHAALDRVLEPLLDRLTADDADTPTPLRQRLAHSYGASLAARGELERAVEFDARVLAATPELHDLRLRLAKHARALGAWETALAALDQAAAALDRAGADTHEIHWDRMIAATVLERWAVVRATASRLGMHHAGPGDEPIHFDFGLVRCEIDVGHGRRERVWANRWSPCTAEIVEIGMPREVQRFRDRVVIEPRDLDAHLWVKGKRHRPCYAVVHLIAPGRQRGFLLRGFDPGSERLGALRDRVRAAGYGYERITVAGREAADPREPEQARVPTVAVMLALGVDEDPSELRALVRDETASWELPLLDPRLDEAAGEPEAAAEAEAMLARWQP